MLGEQAPEPKAGRIEVAADLRTDWSRTLEAAGFDTERAYAWSVEGVLPYLPDEAQNALFTRISGLSAPGSRIAIGALGSRLDRNQLAALESDHPGVNMSGDVDFSALTYEPTTDPAELLAAHGWVVEPVRNTLELQAGYGVTPPGVAVQIGGFMHSQYITASRSE